MHSVAVGLFNALACSSPGAIDESSLPRSSASDPVVERSHEHFRKWYRDEDGDGHGDPDVWSRGLTRPVGFFANATDCDDAHPSVYPGAPATPDGLDNDCDGEMEVALVDETKLWRAQGTTASTYLGVTLATDADVDGDGARDLVLGGLSGALDGDPRQGTVRVFDGPLDTRRGSMDEADASAILYGAMFSQESIVCSVGDLDADGVDDLVIGSPSGGTDAAGVAYVARGPLAGEIDLTVDVQAYEGRWLGEGLGACAGPGDVDGDDAPDVVLAASDIRGGAGKGHVWLLRGPTEHASLRDADQILAGTDDQEYIGVQVARVGDLDADGTSDFAVSNAAGTVVSEDGVAVYLVTDYVSGTMHPRDVAVTVLSGFTGGAGEPRTMFTSGVGDVDNDGYDDVAFGADESNASDRVSLILGPFGTESSVELSTASDMVLTVPASGSSSWLSFASPLGDWNGDGSGVLAIADPDFRPDSVASRTCSGGDTSCSYGAVFLVAEPIEPGTYDLSTSADRIEGVLTHGFMGGGWNGPALEGGSDLSGDGVPDLAFSAWYADGAAAHTGEAYVLFGGG